MEVLFVTLNYDLLLDRRLDVLSPLNTLQDYVKPDRRWALIKLHGSVDWGRVVQSGSVEGPGDLFRPPADLAYSHQIEIAPRYLAGAGESSLNTFRRHPPDGPYIQFPALSVPLGEEDELSCPPEHVEHMTSRIQLSEGLHILVVGYSGIDLEVLNLLKRTDTTIKTLAVVNKDKHEADRVHARMASQIEPRGVGSGWVWPGDFSEFVQGDGWERYLIHLGKN
jgi:hypothetical protein